jgi:uncharacterized SAM-binding protein YcdF (DUF218 family)
MNARAWCRPVALSSFFCASLLLCGCMFSSKTQQRLFAKVKDRQFDLIIVPGIQFENNSWNRTMKGRVYWSKYLFEKGIAKNIMYSGSAVSTPYCEAKIMAQYALALGIPAGHIFIETRAEHSTENVYYSYKLAKKMGFKTIALATDPFQSKQLRRFIRKKVDSDLAIIPFVVDTLKVIEPGMVDPLIDYKQSFKEEFISLKDRESFWKRLRGTRGLNMDKHVYDQ